MSHASLNTPNLLRGNSSQFNFGMLSSALKQFAPKLKPSIPKIPAKTNANLNNTENKVEFKPKSLFDIKLKPLSASSSFHLFPTNNSQNPVNHEQMAMEENVTSVNGGGEQKPRGDSKKRSLSDSQDESPKRTKQSEMEPPIHEASVETSHDMSLQYSFDESDDDCNVDEIQEFFVQHTGKLASTLEELATEMEECKENLDELSVKLLMINNEILLLDNPIMNNERTENIENLIQRIYEE